MAPETAVISWDEVNQITEKLAWQHVEDSIFRKNALAEIPKPWSYLEPVTEWPPPSP